MNLRPIWTLLFALALLALSPWTPADDSLHWAFRPLPKLPPADAGADRGQENKPNPIDVHLEARLALEGLRFSGPADRATLIRRLSFDLIGLPPTPEEIDDFLADDSELAYERVVDRLLASPRFGERWGKHWLDAAGYADSNGYFNADSDRPLAYRYRDYVLASVCDDKPFDRFIREQIAGDELVGFRPGIEFTPDIIEALTATHFLRNSQDGTGESDGNPEEVRIDRYTVLEGTAQIMGSCLFGLTVQCARCHDHKFEPISQLDYYRLQATLFAAYDPDRWKKPNERVIQAASPAQLAAWEAERANLDAELISLRREFVAWNRAHPTGEQTLFHDDFEPSAPIAGGGADPASGQPTENRLSAKWSNAAPGDSPAGAPAVNLDSTSPPGAVIRDGALDLIEAGGAGNRWLATRQSFDWTPDAPGGWIQARFDLVADRLSADETPAARIGYYLALVDYDDDSSIRGGNILVDGDPAGGAAVHLDYPGADSTSLGTLGHEKYSPGRSYGVRVTNAGNGQFTLEHWVDEIPDSRTITVAQADLPDGAFGFEFCCGRSYRVDNVTIESYSPPADSLANEGAKKALEEKLARRMEFEAAVAANRANVHGPPGALAVTTDVSGEAPTVYLLTRGDYGQRGPVVKPGGIEVLSDDAPEFELKPEPDRPSTGGRLAMANWVTKADSRAAALLARVTVNRVWQQHFGVGIVATVDNLGTAGAAPSHPQLLDELAARFVAEGWSSKALHRWIVTSAAYRQASKFHAQAAQEDPENRLLWRFPLLRLDAECVHDAMLAASGELDLRWGGPFTPTTRLDTGEVVAQESHPGAKRRAVYAQQRRTQVTSLLEVFDAPLIVTNCTRRSRSTLPLQSLSLLNSGFAIARAEAFARRLALEEPNDSTKRMTRGFLLAVGREPTTEEESLCLDFLGGDGAGNQAPPADETVWVEFCQLLLSNNAFLYVE